MPNQNTSKRSKPKVYRGRDSTGNYKIIDQTTKELLGYITYTDLQHRYWAPKIWINKLEVIPRERQQGYGTALMKAFMYDNRDKIVMLEVVDGGETHVEYLLEFYGRFGFKIYEETGTGYYMVYFPPGRSERDLKPIPEEILREEIRGYTDNKYELINHYLEELEDDYYDFLKERDLEDTDGAFHEYYEIIKDSVLMNLLK